MSSSHRDLVAWQEAMKLVEMVYQRTAGFPKEEVFGLSLQLRRSAVSIPANIAEGAGRNSSKELFHFPGVASGSLAELETQLELAVRLKFVDACTECRKQVAFVGKLLVGLRNSIKKLDD